jgi:BMFP domain-containing protein YqiC
MTTPTGRFFDELAKVFSTAAGAAQNVRTEIDNVIRTQAERVLNDLNVVQREEFDAVRDLAAKARSETERLERRIADLEAEIAQLRKR